MRSLGFLLVLIVVMGASASPGTASSFPAPMRDAVDAYAGQFATVQDWTYADRKADWHGDYRRAYVTLVFTTDYAFTECDLDGRHCKRLRVPWQWDVEARVARCGPGWYVVSTPYDRHGCPGPGISLRWW